MPYSVAMKNRMLDQLVAYFGTLYGSMHTVVGVTTPGPTGANEATGGSPAYARQALSLAAASGGVKAFNAIPTFDLPAGTYGYFGIWSAATSGIYLGYQVITQVTFASQDVYSLLSGGLSLNAVASA